MTAPVSVNAQLVRLQPGAAWSDGNYLESEVIVIEVSVIDNGRIKLVLRKKYGSVIMQFNSLQGFKRMLMEDKIVT